jgi:hypothetical protein
MTTCPDLGSLRILLDAEPTDREVSRHLEACPDCRADVARLRRDAVLAGAVLRPLAPGEEPGAADTEAALASVRHRVAGHAPGAAAAARRPSRGSWGRPQRRVGSWGAPQRRVAAGAAAAALAVVVVATPGGRSAAAAFLSQFRSERLAVVTVDPQQGYDALQALERFGTVDTGPAPLPVAVASVAEAAELTGLPVGAPDPAALPAGVGPEPSVEVMSARDLRITFSRARAPELPERFDGATLVVSVPAMALLQYQGADGLPGLVVATAGAVTAGVEGNPSLDEVRDFLLDLPDLPSATAAQLRDIEDWRTTLPIPVPADGVAWDDTTVAGGPAVSLDYTGFGSALLWQRDGVIRGVAGPLPVDEVRRVAESLH